MKSLILTSLYLLKDTLHRWCSRISSPLARVLVVFFLTLAALSGMGSYAISAKILIDKISTNGGDTVVVSSFSTKEQPTVFPNDKELSELLGTESFSLHSLGSCTDENGSSIPIYTYDFQRAGQIMPLVNENGVPTILINAKHHFYERPHTVTLNREKVYAVSKKIPEGHLLNRIIGTKGLIIHPDQLPMGKSLADASPILVVRINNPESAEDARDVIKYFTNYTRLEGKSPNIISAVDIFDDLQTALEKQHQCRIAFCLGISVIVGILLTALAGIEYRQNEYIYTLMKSFGIHPNLLVGAFIMENFVLVIGSAAAALYVFMESQQFIITNLLRLGNYYITMPEIMTEIRLIAITLGICNFISAIPVYIAAHRQIGKVLK